MDIKEINIDKSTCSFSICTAIYSIDAIFKAAYIFLDEYYIFLDRRDNDHITIHITAKNNSSVILWDDIVNEFNNELLRQNCHYIIQRDSKNIRELILGRALYEECIEVSTVESEVDSSDYDSDKKNIADAWSEEVKNKI